MRERRRIEAVVSVRERGERGSSECEREGEGEVRERKMMGVSRWWKLIKHRSNEKSKNNNNSSNS